MQGDRQYQTKVAAITESKVGILRHVVAELRQETTTQLQIFQAQVQSYTNQLNQLATTTQAHANQDRVMELVKIKAFDLWIQGRSETEAQLSAQTRCTKSQPKSATHLEP